VLNKYRFERPVYAPLPSLMILQRGLKSTFEPYFRSVPIAAIGANLLNWRYRATSRNTVRTNADFEIIDFPNTLIRTIHQRWWFTISYSNQQ
jgi:hypothetical protein